MKKSFFVSMNSNIFIPFDAIQYNQNLNGRKMNWNVKRNDELFNISVNEAKLS